MITRVEPGGFFQVTGNAPADIYDELNAAVEKARACASTEPRLGILVTRHSSRAFTVALSALVPYGQTFERDDWVFERIAAAEPVRSRKIDVDASSSAISNAVFSLV